MIYKNCNSRMCNFMKFVTVLSNNLQGGRRDKLELTIYNAYLIHVNPSALFVFLENLAKLMSINS